MSGFEIKKDAWHLKWLKWYRVLLKPDNFKSYKDTVITSDTPKNDNYFLPKDFCSYWRAVLLWPAIRIGLNLAVLIAGIWILAILPYTTNALITALIMLGVSIGIIAGIALILAIVWGFDEIKKNANKIYDNIEDNSLFKTIHETYKKNFCPIIVYKEKEDE